MRDIIEEIKSRIDIVDLISEYIKLKPAGKNYKALCPFHKEKVPSFFVSPERQIWHCFGCNAGGDIFSFIMKMENVDFPEALRILAKRAGVEIKKGDYHLKSQKTKLLDILNLASKFYHKILLDSPSAKKAREYLKKRKITNKSIKEFQLGFIPDKWDGVLNFLKKRGFKEEDIEAAGLIIKGEKGKYYDRFRDRIMFPITDVYGQVVGFSGRILPEKEKEEVGKYINTPETLVYNKSKLLYGLDKAKKEIKKQDFAILVEGNMDVIACHQYGSKNVIACSGTALTIQQIKLLKRFTNNLYLCFDMDPAGQTASQRGIDLALQEEMNVKIMQLPKGKDPDECIRKNPKSWFNAIKKAKPIMEYYFDFAFKNYDPKKLEDKKKISNLILPIVSKIADPIERNFWIRFLAEKIDVPEYVLVDKINRSKSRPSYFKKEEENIETKKTTIGEYFLALFLRYPDDTLNYFLEIPSEAFSDIRNFKIIDLINSSIKSSFKKKKLDLKKLKSKLKNQNLESYFNELLFLADFEFERFNRDILEEEIKRLAKRLKYNYFRKRLQEKIKLLREKEEAKDEKAVEKITKEINSLNKKIAQLYEKESKEKKAPSNI